MNKANALENLVKIVSLSSISELKNFLTEIEENAICESSNEFSNLSTIFTKIGFPVCVICEFEYVDRMYRDMYYSYYSGKHDAKTRNCKRLSFFRFNFDIENLTSEDFIMPNSRVRNSMQEAFVGTMVLRPLNGAKIGRTYLDPAKIAIGTKIKIKTTRFSFLVLGQKLWIKAFPFVSQDGEIMSCAEVSYWEIMEYFGQHFSEYRSILPSAINLFVDDNSDERVIPSRGLLYDTMAALFKFSGFAPRNYEIEQSKDDSEGQWREDRLRQLVYTYVESGLPVALELSCPDEMDDESHSIVAIGHTEKREPIDPSMIQKTAKGIQYVNTYQVYKNFVCMDDNKYPYTYGPLDTITRHQGASLLAVSVPLYKRIIMEFDEVDRIVKTCVLENKVLGLEKLKEDFKLSADVCFEINIFLVTSRKYRQIRSKNAISSNELMIYATVQYPKFLWVAEISILPASELDVKKAEGNVCEEVVLDATATLPDALQAIILARQGTRIGYRFPDEDFSSVKERMKNPVDGLKDSFPGCNANLEEY